MDKSVGAGKPTVDVRQMMAREWHTQSVRLRGLGAVAFFLSRGVALGTLVWQCGPSGLEQEGRLVKERPGKRLL